MRERKHTNKLKKGGKSFMEKIHLIGWALLLLLIAGSATTIIVNSIEEAQTKLGTNNVLEEIGCKVYSIEKTLKCIKEKKQR
jgi:hypothetical protein